MHGNFLMKQKSYSQKMIAYRFFNQHFVFHMKSLKWFLLPVCFILLSVIFADAQMLQKPSPYEIKNAPLWAQKMYSDSPNVFEISKLYNIWRTQNLTLKNYHTQYYKHWKKEVSPYINKEGYIMVPKPVLTNYIDDNKKNANGKKTKTSWSLVGPIQTHNADGSFSKYQANVYSITQCDLYKNVMYGGTETGIVFKSVDTGATWNATNVNFPAYISNYPGYAGIYSIAVNPLNPNTIFAGNGNSIRKSTDGGKTWQLSWANSSDVEAVYEILILKTDTQIVFGVTGGGLYKSTNSGVSFEKIFSSACYDIKANPLNPNTLFLLKHNTSLNILQCLKSTDKGITWNIKDIGWYSSTDSNRTDLGGRLAVTTADTNRVYAHLIGESKAGDEGYIGLYKSNDGGNTWGITNAPAGGPYSSSHLNLARADVDGGHHQGFYNCAIMASNTNPNEILVGGTSLWKSIDGGLSFEPIGGYASSKIYIHVDMQDFRAFGNTYWISTDGGIYLSNDFFSSQPKIKNHGIYVTDYWGLGSGWNEDVLIGGSYHNGNIGFHENYGSGNFISIGGGEAPTGYVNPGVNRNVYCSDIGAATLPLHLGVGEVVKQGSFEISPNEELLPGGSSEIEYLPSCYNIAFVGNENKLWKTSDGGLSFKSVKDFGNKVLHIEIGRSNSNVMYVNVSGVIYKTTDGGINWQITTFPSGNGSELMLALDAKNVNHLVVASRVGGVYQTIDGGLTWTQIPTPMFANESIGDIVVIPNTNGGMYVFTSKSVYYKNNATGWQQVNEGLPTITKSKLKSFPFYRDGKIRFAPSGIGIWETVLEEEPTAPVAQAMADKLSLAVDCGKMDTFYFEDYSILNHKNATWSWSFEDGFPNVSNMRNPKVIFNSVGIKKVILNVTNANNISDIDTIYIDINSSANLPKTITEGFENDFPPDGFKIAKSLPGEQWKQNKTLGAFGKSEGCVVFKNFIFDANGMKGYDMSLKLNLEKIKQTQLKFDVAYAQYNPQYSDTLEILVSTDCGNSTSLVYAKGGTTLSTAPDTNRFFTPKIDEWRTDSVDLTTLFGNKEVTLIFRNIGHYGNNIYIDNISVAGKDVTGITTLPNTENVLKLYPNPISVNEKFTLYDPKHIAKYVNIYNNQGMLLQSSNVSPSLQLEHNLAAGIYIIQIVCEEYIRNFEVVVK